MFDSANVQSAAANESYELTNRQTRLEPSQHDSEIERSKVESIASRDAADLARLGKKQVLKVHDELYQNLCVGWLTLSSEISHSYRF